jgi:hypothetical protein
VASWWQLCSKSCATIYLCTVDFHNTDNCREYKKLQIKTSINYENMNKLFYQKNYFDNDFVASSTRVSS